MGFQQAIVYSTLIITHDRPGDFHSVSVTSVQTEIWTWLWAARWQINAPWKMMDLIARSTSHCIVHGTDKVPLSLKGNEVAFIVTHYVYNKSISALISALLWVAASGSPENFNVSMWVFHLAKTCAAKWKKMALTVASRLYRGQAIQILKMKKCSIQRRAQ